MPTLNLAINARSASGGGRDFLIILDRIISTSGRARLAVSSIFSGLAGLLVLRQVIAGFEQTMTTLRAVTNATDAEFEKIEATTRRLGATTRFAAREIAEAELIFARAGYGIGESLVASREALQLAQSSATGLATAADVLNSALHQFNLTGYDSKRVADALTIAANRTATDVQEMGEALKYAGTTAGLLGVSVEDTSNLIGVLGDRGIRASIAGTNLRSVLLRLVAVTDEGRKSLSAYGISTRDVNTGTQDIVSVLEKLKPLLGDSQAAVKLFTLRNVGAAQALIASTDKLRELRREQLAYAGETSRIAKLQDQTLIGSFKKLRAVLEEAALQIGDAGLSGGLKSLVNTFTLAVRDLLGFKNAATATSEAAQNLSIALAAFAGASIMRGVVLLTGAVIRLGVALAVSAVTNPFTLLVVAVGAAAGLVYKFRDSIVEVSGHVVRLGTFATEVFKSIGERVGLLAKFIGTIAPEMFKMISADVKTFLGVLQTNFNGLGTVLFGGFKQLFEVIGTLAKDLGNTLIGVFIGALDAIDALLKIRAQNIELIMLNLGGAMQEVLEGDFAGARQSIANAWDLMAKDASDASTAISSAFKGALGGQDYIGELGNQVKRTFKEIGATFEEFLSGEGFKGGLKVFFNPFIIGAEAAAKAAKETAEQAAHMARVWATTIPIVKQLAVVMPLLAAGFDIKPPVAATNALRDLKVLTEELSSGPQEGDLGGDKNYSTILQQRGEIQRMNDLQLESFTQSNAELEKTVDLFNLGLDAQKSWIDERALELDLVEQALIKSGELTSVEADRIALARKRIASDRETLGILEKQVSLSQLLNNYRQFQGNVENAAFNTGFDLKTLGLSVDELERANNLRQMGVASAEQLLRVLERQRGAMVAQAALSLGSISRSDLERFVTLTAQTQEIKKQVEDAKKLVDQQQKLGKLRQFSGDLARGLGDAANSFLQNLASGKDILKKLFQDTLGTVVQHLVIDKLVGSLSGVFEESFAASFGVEKSLVTGSASAGQLLLQGGQAAGLAIETAAAHAALLLGIGKGVGAAGGGAGGAGGGGSSGTALDYGGTVDAYGAAYANGQRITAFAGGGVVNSPTGFSYGRGQRGLMGERGPEGILPLRRTSSGALGVASDGGGARPVVNMTVYTQDAASFKRSRRQINNQIGDALKNRR